MFELVALTFFSLSVHSTNLPEYYTHQLGGGVTYHPGANLVLQTENWDHNFFYFQDSLWTPAAGYITGPELWDNKKGFKGHFNFGGYMRFDASDSLVEIAIDTGNETEIIPMFGLGMGYHVQKTPLYFKCLIAVFVNNCQIGFRAF